MITLKLKQGTDEWLEARLEHLTASEAPAMMGNSKFMSRNQLLALKKGWKSNPNSKYKEMLFQKGHDFEALARELVEAEIEEDLYPVTGKVAVDGLELLASFDGLSCDEVTLWEHKMWNSTLAENVRNGVLEPHYYWQIEHQLLVCGADRCIFSVSDGTPEKFISMNYVSVPELRKELIAGWVQFEKDLLEYQIEAIQEVVIAAKAESFPLVTYQVTGTEISSNIADCLDIITQRSQLEIARVLENDQDFIDKDKLNKATKTARASLKTMVQEVQGKFVSYSEFASVAAEIDSVLQIMQSNGEKQVKKAKADKKQAIEDSGFIAVRNHIDEINKTINPITLMSIMNCQVNIAESMKNKRTIESLQCAVDDVVSQFKIESNQVSERVKVNLTTLREMAGEYKFLFKDTPQLVTKDNEDLVAVIKTRIADHKVEEEKTLEDGREKIRKEEEAKAEQKVKDDQAAKEKLKPTQEKQFEDAVTTGVGIVDGEGNNIPAKDFYKKPEDILPEEPQIDHGKTKFPLMSAFKKTQGEVKKTQGTSELVKEFLQWSITRDKSLNDFGCLLKTDDPGLRQDALSRIKTDFNTYTGS